MKASFTFVVLFAGALSMGCVAQTGPDESSQAEGLTADQAQVEQVAQKQEPATMKQRVQLAPRVLTQPVSGTDLPQMELKELSGTDPGGNVQDDGDGKEPDPHPWHTSALTLVSH